MKNNPKSTFGSILLATTLLGGHAYMKDASSQVNEILCHKTGKSEIKKGRIIVYNDIEGSCYINGGNTAFFDEISRIQRQQKFKEVVVYYSFYSKPSWEDSKMIIKIDGSRNGTWLSDFYIYQKVSGKLENLGAITLDDAIAKVENTI